MTRIYSRQYRLNHLYKIVDKKGDQVTFKMNPIQIELHEILNKVKRVFILKGRQFGITTYQCIRSLDRAIFKENQNLVITAHNREKQGEIFKIVKYAYQNMPDQVIHDGAVVWVKPKATYDNVNELQFENNNSRISVSLDSRGVTVHGLHITEISSRADAQDMMSGTLPAVPDDAPITIETTAKGQSGPGRYAHDLWKLSEKGESGFFPVFFAWWRHDEYMKQAQEGWKTTHPEYEEYMKSQGVKHISDRLFWYETHEKNIGRDMKQEYPTYPEEAFLTTGNPVFPIEIIKKYEDTELYYDMEGQIRIYRHADECKDPFDLRVGVDTAGGNALGDFSCVEMRDTEYNLIAHWYEKAPPESIFNVLCRLDDLGYGGIIGVEINATSGGELISMCKNHQFKNFSLYRRKSPVDSKNDRVTSKIGFLTSGATREQILDKFERFVRQGLVEEFDPRTLHEMKYFYMGEGRREATPGEHDDAILTSAICLRMCDENKDTAF